MKDTVQAEALRSLYEITGNVNDANTVLVNRGELSRLHEREESLVAEVEHWKSVTSEVQDHRDALESERDTGKRVFQKDMDRIGELTIENASLRSQVIALQADAELGKTAIRFVDRAGDPHPGIDDAERICTEFYEAMAGVISAARTTKETP